MQASFEEIGIAKGVVTAMTTNVWTNERSIAQSPISVDVEPHDVVFLIVDPRQYSEATTRIVMVNETDALVAETKAKEFLDKKKPLAKKKLTAPAKKKPLAKKKLMKKITKKSATKKPSLAPALKAVPPPGTKKAPVASAKSTDSDDEKDYRFRVEYAKTARSTCRGCKKLIEKGIARVASRPLFQGKPGYMVFRQMQCQSFPKEISQISEIGGYRRLNENDLDLLHKQIMGARWI
ncbi:MAG: hypothetical protein SGARI_000379 [Bacillariaceae sp.]